MTDTLFLDREELAWAGGLFEGEGCFSTGRGSRSRGGEYYNRTTKLAMTDEDSVRRFAAALGVGTVRKVEHRTGWKNIYVWQVSSFEGVQHVVATLWPWLGRRRHAAAALALL